MAEIKLHNKIAHKERERGGRRGAVCLLRKGEGEKGVKEGGGRKRKERGREGIF